MANRRDYEVIEELRRLDRAQARAHAHTVSMAAVLGLLAGLFLSAAISAPVDQLWDREVVALRLEASGLQEGIEDAVSYAFRSLFGKRVDGDAIALQ